MAKTFNNLYPRICSLENLYAATRTARKRKTRKEYVERFELHRERFVRRLQEELESGSYRPGGYRQFYIHEPKQRLISAAPYRDRVVHHALYAVTAPLIERRFIDDSFSCRKGKGTLAGRERCRQYTNRFKYVLKCDIRKYFQSIDHEVLKDKLARIIRCKPTLELCGKIIDSCREDILAPIPFPDDDLFSLPDRVFGLPIGNLTSQLWANLYLDRLDHVIREILRVQGYARYTDDFLLWSDDKSFLHECRERIADELREERLLLHPVKSRVLQCREGVPFLGFRFFPKKSPRLAADTKRRFEKRARRQTQAVRSGEAERIDVQRSMRGWAQFALYGNVEGLFQAYRRNGFSMGHAGT